jgi:hypothetical protein
MNYLDTDAMFPSESRGEFCQGYFMSNYMATVEIKMKPGVQYGKDSDIPGLKSIIHYYRNDIKRAVFSYLFEKHTREKTITRTDYVQLTLKNPMQEFFKSVVVVVVHKNLRKIQYRIHNAYDGVLEYCGDGILDYVNTVFPVSCAHQREVHYHEDVSHPEPVEDIQWKVNPEQVILPEFVYKKANGAEFLYFSAEPYNPPQKLDDSKCRIKSSMDYICGTQVNKYIIDSLINRCKKEYPQTIRKNLIQVNEDLIRLEDVFLFRCYQSGNERKIYDIFGNYVYSSCMESEKLDRRIRNTGYFCRITDINGESYLVNKLLVNQQLLSTKFLEDTKNPEGFYYIGTCRTIIEDIKIRYDQKEHLLKEIRKILGDL